MSFPTIQFKFTSIDQSETPHVLLEDKFQSLGKFVGEETDVKCEVEFEKVTNSKSGEVHRVEANLWLHGKMYRAEATENSFEAATDEVRNELDKELRRANDKRHSLIKRGGRAIKEMLRFSK